MKSLVEKNMEQGYLFGSAPQKKSTTKEVATPKPFPKINLTSGAEARSYIAGEAVFWLRILQNQTARNRPFQHNKHHACLMNEFKFKKGHIPSHLAVRDSLMACFIGDI